MDKSSSLISSTLTIGLVGLVVGLGIGYGIGLNRIGTPSLGNHMMSNGAVMNDTMMGNIDQHFIIQMIPHHEGAIAMAKIALERSKRPETLSLAEDIIKAQQKEIDDMRSWYQSWFGTTPPAGSAGMMHMGSMSGDEDRLQSVSAVDFDREFVQQMIPHHEMAIMMAQMLQASTQRGEMKQLADNIITSQSREIQMMRGWITNWYGN